ncbi:DUF2953 domain-containing protein [Neomoorella humiferrea]|uniref:DUF2953 domain-containing protein n=1 Tax=Neomoorella humiferrea TaxID=676965 RepID=UPI003D8A1F60
MWAWTAGFFTACLLMLLLPVHLEITFRQNNGNTDLKLQLGLPGGWGGWEVNVASSRQWWAIFLQDGVGGALCNDSDAGTGRDRRRWVNRRSTFRFHILRKIIEIWGRFFNLVTCRRWRLFLTLGTGDPATTAFTCGAVWVVTGWMYRNLKQHACLDFSTPEWHIQPSFDKPTIVVDFRCIFVLRLGHIISACLQSLWLVLKEARLMRRGKSCPSIP